MSAVNLHDVVASPREDRNLRAEWHALTAGAGAIRHSDFGVLRVEGRDRVSWLDNLVTADVEAMSDGAGAYALLLEAKAHVLADFVLLRQSDSILVYTSRAAHEKLYFNLSRAIFREKVALTDLSDQFAIISIQGPNAQAVAQKTFDTNLSILNLQFAQLQFTTYQLLFIHHPRASTNSFDMLAPRDAIPALWDVLLANGAQPVGLDALNITRVEAGIPWYGTDFDETTLALEARLDAFIAENKGCYPGQEVIARIRNLGHVNRLLVQFQIEGDVIPSRGDLAFVDHVEAGWITSPVWSFARNAPLALGYTRREWAADGARVQIAHGNTRLSAIVKEIG